VLLGTTEHVELVRYIRQGLLTSDSNNSQADNYCSIRSINLTTLSKPANSIRQIYLVVKLEFSSLLMRIFVSFQINCYGKKRIQQDISQ